MREWGTSHYQQSLKGGGRVPTVNCLRTDKLLVKRGGWGLKIHKNIKEPYGGCKI